MECRKSEEMVALNTEARSHSQRISDGFNLSGSGEYCLLPGSAGYPWARVWMMAGPHMCINCINYSCIVCEVVVGLR